MRKKITKRTVDAAQPSKRDAFIWDTETRGFGLKVTPAGNRIYVVQARLNGRPIRYTIGKHGAPWTADKAREEALRRLGQIAAGTNPNEEKAESQRDLSIAQLCGFYVTEGCSKKKPSTLAVERGLIERHIKPLLGKQRVKALNRAKLERFMSDVANGKTATDIKCGNRGRAIVKGGKGTANRTMDLLASMMTYAVHAGLRPDNPARGIKKYPLKPRERYLSSKELAALGEALNAAEAEGENPYAVAAIRLLALTGCRKGEALSLRWDWVDFERVALRLPVSKTGAKSVPLGAPALELLNSLARVDGNPHVFPGAKGDGHFVGLQKVWTRIRARAGMNDLRLHDLRHSFASVGVGAGDSLYIVGKLLGHTQSRTTQRYAHLADDPLRVAAERISGQIAAAMTGEGGKVVKLKHKAKARG
jgi:integrase